MIFCELQENHLDLLKKYLPAYANGDCDLSLVSLLSRGMASQFRFAEFQCTHLILERKLDNQTVLSMPIGQSAAPQALFDELAALAKEKCQPLRFFGLIDADQSVLAQSYPERELIVENNPDRWDYVYACSDFVRLEGSHFHSKRNFVKRFFKACLQQRDHLHGSCRYRLQSIGRHHICILDTYGAHMRNNKLGLQCDDLILDQHIY